MSLALQANSLSSEPQVQSRVKVTCFPPTAPMTFSNSHVPFVLCLHEKSINKQVGPRGPRSLWPKR